MGSYAIPAFWDVPFYVCNKVLQLYDYAMDIILNTHKAIVSRDYYSGVSATKVILLILKDKFLYMTWQKLFFKSMHVTVFDLGSTTVI